MPSTSAPIAEGSINLSTIEVGSFRVTDALFPPELRLPSHYHERTCLAVVLEGSLDKAFPRADYYSPASTAITMPPHERHRDFFMRAGAHMLVLEPDPAAGEMIRPCMSALDRVSHMRSGAMVALAWRISEEVRHPDAVSHIAVEGLALEMLAAASRQAGLAPSEKRPPPWLNVVEELVRAGFMEPLMITEVAAHVGVHPVHLARVFRSHFGESFGQYLRRLRLDWAATQLSRPDVTLCDLAAKAGFSDQSHFTRVFKKHTGLTPARYRTLTAR